MIDILKNLQDKLAAIPVDNETTKPILNYVDEDWGQLDDYGQPPVKWPCCLIDIQQENYTDIGQVRNASPVNRQEGTLTIVLNIANLKLTNSSGKAPQAQKDKAWLIHDIKEKVHQAIHGWAPVQGQGKIMRTSARKIKRDDGIQQHQVFYTIGVHNV